MNRDEIIRLAIECQLVTTGNRDGFYMDALAQFAALVAAAEREACAKVAARWDADVETRTKPSDAIRTKGEV